MIERQYIDHRAKQVTSGSPSRPRRVTIGVKVPG